MTTPTGNDDTHQSSQDMAASHKQTPSSSRPYGAAGKERAKWQTGAPLSAKSPEDEHEEESNADSQQIARAIVGGPAPVCEPVSAQEQHVLHPQGLRIAVPELQRLLAGSWHSQLLHQVLRPPVVPTAFPGLSLYLLFHEHELVQQVLDTSWHGLLRYICN